MTQRDVARAMDWSLSKLIRIETGAVSITTTDLRALLSHYGVTDQARVDALVDTARASRERSPWTTYRNVASPELIAFLGYESSATVIRSFQPLLIPGLLQTEEYAREISDAIGETEGLDKKQVDELVDMRMERQALLIGDRPPSLHFILDEAVIRRIVGGPDLMRRQLRRLRDAAAEEFITIRIVPFSVGVYPRMLVSYVLFEFPEPDDDYILYIESSPGEMITRESYPEDESTPSAVNYLATFYQLEQVARADEAVGIIDAAIAALPSGG